ncbi:N-acetyltransferase [Ktedonobacter sp. SOSP1-85]|uniref:GNAT family N-acetyltransferase n=1 Tax=Ktedonobacter sp. SOSP1-85 TaxID=2778367 RepID=UPI001915AB28|nr:GNAT family N-acetyltransferase [Ktedonobacter sp. SOSP1-85]GHO78699.1 N-acetyltransferase [Ktedonobacter sp. SOSP1-85]
MHKQGKQASYHSQYTLTTELETEHLVLRRPTQQDGEVLFQRWLADELHQPSGDTLTQEETHQCIANVLRHWDQYGFGCWSVFERGKHQPAGLCGLTHTQDEIELTYSLTSEYWEHDFATEATTACLAYGFRVLGIERIIAHTHEENPTLEQTLAQILTKLGMHQREHGETWHVYEITRAKWTSQHLIPA